MLLEIILQQQGFSLVDLFGENEVVEEFWASPDVGQNPKKTQGEWHILLVYSATYSRVNAIMF
jgi:hypothetical protein